MTISQLNLANELNDRIQKLKTEREKHKKAFDITCANIKEDKLVIVPVLNSKVKVHSIEDDIQKEITQDESFCFPSEEFAEFLEHKIIKIDVLLHDVEEKFKQL